MSLGCHLSNFTSTLKIQICPFENHKISWLDRLLPHAHQLCRVIMQYSHYSVLTTTQNSVPLKVLLVGPRTRRQHSLVSLPDRLGTVPKQSPGPLTLFSDSFPNSRLPHFLCSLVWGAHVDLVLLLSASPHLIRPLQEEASLTKPRRLPRVVRLGQNQTIAPLLLNLHFYEHGTACVLGRHNTPILNINFMLNQPLACFIPRSR